jgi:uncharacterized membrane protein YheB (UPF0754 family)
MGTRFKDSKLEWSISKEVAEEYFNYMADETDEISLTKQEWVTICLSIDELIEERIAETIVDAIDEAIKNRKKG